LERSFWRTMQWHNKSMRLFLAHFRPVKRANSPKHRLLVSAR
jgi:hypothetical protein